MQIDSTARRHAPTICCSACRGPALTDPVLTRKIQPGDEALFADLPGVTLRRDPDGAEGHEARYKPAPGVPDLGSLDLPDRYRPAYARWEQTAAGESVVTCLRCGRVETRPVRLPDEYFYQIDFRGEPLWAPSLDAAEIVLAFIEGDDRRRKPATGYKHGVGTSFLGRIPSHFLTAKARDTVAARLRKRIEEGMA